MAVLSSIAILAPSPVPFQAGGAEKFWLGLRNALEKNTNAMVELIKMPAPEANFIDIINSYKSFSALDLSHFDLLITSKYPAWIANHPNHICYMLHPLRGLYDHYPLFDQPFAIPHTTSSLSALASLLEKADPVRADLNVCFELLERVLKDRTIPSSCFSFPGPLIKAVVHFFDKIALSPKSIKGWLAISETVARRSDYFPENADVKILHPPSDLFAQRPEKGEYFFTASRLTAAKRIDLLIKAMAYFPYDIPLKITGIGPEYEKLRTLASSDRRIQFLGRVSDQEMTQLYAHAIGVPFIPFEEDYGLIAVEAMQAGKPVITTFDSGGVQELIHHEKTGLVVAPDAMAIAKAMRTLVKNPELALSLGNNGKKAARDLTWRQTALSLLSHAHNSMSRFYPRILVLSSFPANKESSGGHRRLYHYCKQLSSGFDVHLICYGNPEQKECEIIQLESRFKQTILPRTVKIDEETETIQKTTGVCAEDIAIMRYASEDETLLALLKQENDADCAIVSHPWLFPALTFALPSIPIIYEAQDVEADMKRYLFGENPIVSETLLLEKKVCERAHLISVCSKKDKQRLEALYEPSAPILILPHGCEYTELSITKEELRKRLPYPKAKLLLFLGSLHGPNIEGVKALASIAHRVPEAQFLIAGSVCQEENLKNTIQTKNFHLLGPISEKVKNILLQGCDLALNPVTSGSGVNLKTIEYIFYGIPLISTPFGMRGLPDTLFPAVHICDLENFTKKIHALLQSPPKKEELENVRNHFIKEYNWCNTLAQLVPEIDKTLAAIKASRICESLDHA